MPAYIKTIMDVILNIFAFKNATICSCGYKVSLIILSPVK
jgi:hypothetical protein